MRSSTLFLLQLLPAIALTNCNCSTDEYNRDKSVALPLKLTAIFSVLVGGFIGVCIPIFGKWVPARTETCYSS